MARTPAPLLTRGARLADPPGDSNAAPRGSTLAAMAAQHDGRYAVERAVAELAAHARDYWGEYGRRYRWTLFGRLSWWRPIPPEKARGQLERWITRLRRRHPEVVVLAGIHLDTHLTHAHVLIYRPAPGAPPNPTPERWPRRIVAKWFLRWTHGPVWVERFQPARQKQTHGGAGWYVAKTPSEVVVRGTPVPYVPQRRRRH
jgi:hypothetical protein